MKILRVIVKKLIHSLIDKPIHAPTKQELTLVEQLRSKFRNFAPIETLETQPSSEKTWNNNLTQLRVDIFKKDPRKFLRWKVVGRTMYVRSPSYLSKELGYLKHRNNWQSRWKNVLAESKAGHPLPYWRFRRSSGNLIHQAHHIANFEEYTKIDISKVDNIIEFGGGYGCAARLIHQLGFQGKYLILDLPDFSALQEFYLKSAEQPIITDNSFEKSKTGILCISDMALFKDILRDQIDFTSSIFIATWSLSETPISLRKEFWREVSECSAFLISSQSHYQEVDNIEYFQNLSESNNQIKWTRKPILHLGKNFYLFGTRKL